MTDWSVDRWTAFFALLTAACVSVKQVWDWAGESRRKANEAAALREATAKAAREVEEAAEKARALVQATARKDALEEWQKLYGEKDRIVAGLQAQNADQQKQLDECIEDRRDLRSEVEAVKGRVTKVEKNGHG